MIGGAFPTNCRGKFKNEDGLSVGAGSWVGNPLPIVRFGAGEHPGVVVPPMVEEQVRSNPGTRPAAAVT